MRFEKFTKMESDEGIRKEHDEQLYGDMLEEANFIFEKINGIDLYEEDTRKQLMSDIISKACDVKQFIDNNKRILLNSEVFGKIHNLSLINKYANLNVDDLSEGLLNRVDFNKQILDVLNQLDVFFNKLVIYETNKTASFEQKTCDGGIKM